jgi:hypothetical protein
LVYGCHTFIIAITVIVISIRIIETSSKVASSFAVDFLLSATRAAVSDVTRVADRIWQNFGTS